MEPCLGQGLKCGGESSLRFRDRNFPLHWFSVQRVFTQGPAHESADKTRRSVMAIASMKTLRPKFTELLSAAHPQKTQELDETSLVRTPV